MLVARSNKGETVVHGDLIGRKGETKVRLREGRHRSTKNSARDWDMSLGTQTGRKVVL
jgi:hypothetical protein